VYRYLLTVSLREQGKKDEARKLARRVVEDSRRIQGPKHQQTANYENLLKDLLDTASP
jgi:hypothetical protein